jgi:predicted ATPase
MISRLEIKGFKSLVDVSIELGAVNVFIGANGSGKSNLLEAVGILSSIVSQDMDAESIYRRGVRAGRPASFLSSLIDQTRRSISIEANDDETSYKVDFGPDERHPSRWLINNESIAFGGDEVLKRTADGFQVLQGAEFDQVNIVGHSGSMSVAPFLRYYFMRNRDKFQPDKKSPDVPYLSFDFLEELRRYAIFSLSTPQLRGIIPDTPRDPLGLGGSQIERAVADMMECESDMLGPFYLDDIYELIDWADSFEIESDAGFKSNGAGEPARLRIGDRYMGMAHKSVSLLEASEGALYVLAMLALVGHEQSPKLFAVDNFDQALHPRLACALTRLISEQILDDGSRQMLATTHNPLVLDGLDLLDDRIRLFTVDRDSTGASQVRRVLVTEELIDKGFSLSRLWTSGRFGGVPRNL